MQQSLKTYKNLGFGTDELRQITISGIGITAGSGVIPVNEAKG
jgi:hypothetical protein